jgi:hypothetical protein
MMVRLGCDDAPVFHVISGSGRQIPRACEGRAYYERKRLKGKTDKEALRCLIG